MYEQLSIPYSVVGAVASQGSKYPSRGLQIQGPPTIVFIFVCIFVSRLSKLLSFDPCRVARNPNFDHIYTGSHMGTKYIL